MHHPRCAQLFSCLVLRPCRPSAVSFARPWFTQSRSTATRTRSGCMASRRLGHEARPAEPATGVGNTRRSKSEAFGSLKRPVQPANNTTVLGDGRSEQTCSGHSPPLGKADFRPRNPSLCAGLIPSMRGNRQVRTTIPDDDHSALGIPMEVDSDCLRFVIGNANLQMREHLYWLAVVFKRASAF